MIDRPPQDATLSADQARHIDQTCDRFEAAWKAVSASGARPRIEDAMQEVSEEDRPRLLRELIHLDIFYRCQLGETPQPSDYQSRFPSLDAASRAALFAHSPTTADVASTPIPNMRAETPAADSTPLSRRFRCPHCHNPIQLADDHSDEVLCPGCGSSFRVREAKETISATPMRPLGKFQLLERIGTGGFGAVWRARDTTLDCFVALKIPHTGLLTAAQELERFQREARAAAQLRHPGIVHVTEVVTLDGLPTIVSDFVVGVSLKELLETSRLTFRESAALIAAVADAAHYAHTQNVIHRDLKPANIMIPYAAKSSSASSRRMPQLDRPMLMDFGLALRSEAEVTLTQEGNILGTPAYMSPEQAAGHSHKADARSDVWSLGVILYELLCGELPFRGSKLMIMTQVINDDPRAPRRVNERVPRDLETICHKCLVKEPAARYASAESLAEDLRRFLAGEPILARPAGAGERLWRWCRRNPRVAALSAALAFLLVIWAATSSVLYSIAARNERKAEENEQTAIKEAARADANAETSRMRQQEAFLEMTQLVHALLNWLRSRRLTEQLGPETRVMQQQLLDQLRKKMLNITGDSEARGIDSFGNVAIYQQMGDLLLMLGQGDQALQHYENGRKLAEKILQEQSNNDRARANLGIMMMRLGDIALEVNGDSKTARDYYQKGWDLQNEVCVQPHDRDFPAQQKAIVLSHHAVHLGRACLAMGRPTEAAKHFEQALKLRQEWALAMARNPESRGWLVEVNMWLGTTAWHREDAKAFTQYFHEALQLMEALVKESPGFTEFRGDLAEVYAAQAEGLTRLGRLDEARTSYQRARENLKLVKEKNPDNLKMQPLLPLSHERLGTDAQRRGQQPEAHKHYQEALSIRQEFTRLEPGNRVWQAAYLLALARCGKYAEAARGADALRPQAANSTELLLQLARCHAVCASQAPDKQGSLTKALETLRVLAALDYRDPVLVRTDPDLAALRTEPAFLSLLDKWDKERE